MFAEKELIQYGNKGPLKAALGIPKEKELSLTLLGQGEYNVNYRFSHPVTGKKLVLRVNTGSQMHLEKQITYEYEALKVLECSGRTPKVCFLDDTREFLPWGLLVMEFLEGRPLSYETDLRLAAACLADIHSVPVPEKSHFLRPENPFQAMVEECTAMAGRYLSWDGADPAVGKRITRLLRKAEAMVPKEYGPGSHIINTELNSGNFLINGAGKRNFLIDWEKPLLGDLEQDLGHFLAPTTTFWKTDTILGREEMEEFLREYEKAVDGRFPLEGLPERFSRYLILTCLRGITWCAMAYVEYQSPDRAIKNAFTYEKIQAYLRTEFLDFIEKEYYGGTT